MSMHQAQQLAWVGLGWLDLAWVGLAWLGLGRSSTREPHNAGRPKKRA